MAKWVIKKDNGYITEGNKVTTNIKLAYVYYEEEVQKIADEVGGTPEKL